MADSNRITINMDESCKRCGEKGVTDSGLCLACVAKAISNLPPPAQSATSASGGETASGSPGASGGETATDIRKKVQDRVEKENETYPAKEKEEEKITGKFIRECHGKNELGDALIYAELFRNKFVYSKEMKEWFTWSGNYWELDIMDSSLAAVEQVALTYAREAQNIYVERSKKIAEGADSGSDEMETLKGKAESFLKRTSGLRTAAKRRAACREMAHTMENPMAISGKELDKHPMLFPCKNGVIDLETGLLKPGRPSDYMSMASPIDFIGIDDHSELWEKSLLEIYNCSGPDADRSIVEYIQRLMGYAITGYSHQKVFPIFYGKGGWNGRSVILETVSEIMGAMAGPIPSEMLLSQKFAKSASGPSPDVMKLKGLRLAIATETDENQRFSASKIKWYTGNNKLTGRWPNDKRPIDFDPTHTLFLETNYQPTAPANDRSFWERVHLIPHNISYVDRDPRELNEKRANLNLKKELKKDHPKILGWMVRGCLLWQKYGLKPPAIVTEATKKYREDEDLIGDWISECCIREPLAKEKASLLFNSFREWYHANIGKGDKLTGTWFGKQLSQKFEKDKETGCIMYHGLKLATMGDA